VSGDLTEAPDFVDEITNMLTRVYPGEVEAGELEQEIGASSEELRTATEWMRANGRLDGDAEHFKIAQDGDGVLPQHTPPAEEELDTPAEEVVKAATTAPASDELPVRVVFSLTTSFGRGVDESDDSVVKKCEALFEEIQKGLSGAIPKLEIIMDVEEINTYDQPRRIFPPEGK
jgi:hypothetical protein